ncbi:MAG: FAD-binding oxidoreductase [Verrucomicrobia bacterium]|nr:FAD-binding oxidoreductase [Verrucomicrobiota bacterium]
MLTLFYPIELSADERSPKILNDVHSRLNPTQVNRIVRPNSAAAVIEAIRQAKKEHLTISISGAKHSMGGQPFAVGAMHLDMLGMNQFIALDPVRRLARVEAGITWPTLLAELEKRQQGVTPFLTIAQKQTGADELTLGGAVSSNIHGRGLQWQPFVQDIESLTLVDANAQIRVVSRTQEPELFRLIVGGYGLFGVITEVELRLIPRQRVERQVQITILDGLTKRIEEQVKDGCLLGDFQFCPDESSPGFLREGVFACYRTLSTSEVAEKPSNSLRPEAWRKLIVEAHRDKSKAWQSYTDHYRLTQGQRYWHDLTQFSHYDTDYEERIEQALPDLAPGSLMISELYVPRDRLEDFMAGCAADFRQHGTNVIYGTIRFIRRDDESFLAWAKEDYACIVFNLRVTHTDEGKEKAKMAFRRLIDQALDLKGSFYLTYHRWATREQMKKAYPQFPAFLQHKLKYDPEEVFQSEWYRHWRAEFSAIK